MNRRRLSPTLLHAWLLAALLLAAQAAGLAHRIAHAPGSSGTTASSWLVPDHEKGSPGCRLVDQLTQADVLCSGEAVIAALPQPQAEPEAASAAFAPRAFAAPYDARGPPRG